MLIGRIEGATRVLGKSQGYIGLPIRDEVRNTTVDGEQTPVMVTAWEPTPDEIDRINCGAPVQLCVVGTGHPPVMLEVGKMPKDEVYEQVMAMSEDELRAELAAEGKTMEIVAAEGRAIFEQAKVEAEMRTAIRAWLRVRPIDKRPSAQALGLRITEIASKLPKEAS